MRMLGALPVCFAGLLAVSSLAARAGAAECKADADCQEGDICIRSVNPECPPEVECPDDGTSGSGRCERPCNVDDDCGAGQECVPFAIDCTDEAECPPTQGVCEYRPPKCQTDADCAEGFECRPEGGSSDGSCGEAPCTTDAGTGDDPGGKPLAEETLRCQPKPLECGSDEDCPAPLTCETYDEGTCTKDSSGGEHCDENEVRRCVWRPTECIQDADCDLRYECVEDASGGSVVGGGGEPDTGGGSDPGSGDGARATERFCFPQFFPCEADAECDGDWTCTNLEAHAVEVPWWKGATHACLPPGVVAVVDGRATMSGIPGSDGKGTPETGDTAEEPSKIKEVSGCSIGRGPFGPGSGSSGALLGALMLLFGRRSVRRARR